MIDSQSTTIVPGGVSDERTSGVADGQRRMIRNRLKRLLQDKGIAGQVASGLGDRDIREGIPLWLKAFARDEDGTVPFLKRADNPVRRMWGWIRKRSKEDLA